MLRRLSVNHLADRAIDSARVGVTGPDGKPLDGISYLEEVVELDLPEELTKDYEDAILRKLGAGSLDEAFALVREQVEQGSESQAGTVQDPGPAAPPAVAAPATAGNTGPGQPAPEDSLRAILVRVAGAVAAGIGVVGFVAVVGGAYFWLRFSSAGLPADEAVADMSHSQLLVVGIRELFPFIAIAVIEVVALYLVEQAVRGDLTRGPVLNRIANYAARTRSAVGQDRLILQVRAWASLIAVVIVVVVDFVAAERTTVLSILLAALVALGLALIVLLYARSSNPSDLADDDRQQRASGAGDPTRTVPAAVTSTAGPDNRRGDRGGGSAPRPGRMHRAVGRADGAVTPPADSGARPQTEQHCQPVNKFRTNFATGDVIWVTPRFGRR